jgi:hypothetical protein
MHARLWISAAAVACVLAASSRADTLSNEFMVGRTETTPANPRSGNVSDLLSASFDLREKWTLSLGGQVTLEGTTNAPPGEPVAFRDRGGTIANFIAGVDYDLTDSWTLGASLAFSPKSTTGTNAELTLEDNTTGTVSTANTLVRSTNSNATVELLASYDTPGDSNLEWSFEGGVALSSFTTQQKIEAVQFSGGRVLTPTQLRAACALPGSRCPPALLKALDAQSDDLGSARFSGAVTAIVYADTDLTLSGDYFGYNENPNNAGYFSIGSAGRSGVSGGSGVAIAPLRWLVRPEVTHRFGDFSLKLWAMGGQYVKGAGGSSTGAGLKAQYKFTKTFKMWAAASGQSDVDSSGTIAHSATFGLGVQYKY